IMDNTSYGSGTTLLDAAGKFGAGAVTFQIGSTAAETLDVDVSTELGDITTTLGAITGLTDQADSSTTMAEIDTLIGNIGSARANLGASMNRLDHTISNLTNMTENTQASASQLMDADFAKETSSMTKQQLLMNSGISVLSASNSTTQMIGSLLR
ncbi:MAG TPA: flagellin, partial [Rheinheimera sp.]|nr:flagellin [Rheinheimera sp.]